MDETSTPLTLVLRVLQRRGHEAGEQRVRVIWLGLELGVELRADIERVVRLLFSFTSHCHATG